MNETTKLIAWSLLWFGIGTLTAYISMWSLKTGVDHTIIDGKAKFNGLFILGTFFRWALIAVLLFFAVRMNIIYALVLIAGFSIMRFYLIIQLARERKRKNEENEQKE